MSIDGKMNRRRLLKQAAGVAAGGIALPYIIPAHVLAAEGSVAPSSKITMACIGLGMQGPGNMQQFMKGEDCKVVAVCDIDKKHLRDAVNMVNDYYQNKDCAAYSDFREVLSRGTG